MAGLITTAEDDTVSERVTLDPTDCRLLASAVRQVSARARSIGATDAVVERLERIGGLVERVARRSANLRGIGHDVGTGDGRLADDILLNVKQVQTLLCVSERTARRKAKQAGAVIIGGKLRVARENVEAIR